MNIFTLPNLLSLGNLLCGCLAVLNVIDGNASMALYLVMVACVFDFLDGFAARGLKQGSPMGKELDSLSDMVTFGVVPGMVMFQMIRFAQDPTGNLHIHDWRVYLPYVGFIIPLFSALRLAKFNVDTKQSESFIGMPTLANALLVCGLPIMFELQDNSFVTFNGYGYLMHAYIPNTWNSLTTAAEMIAHFWRTPATLIVVTIALSFLLISPLKMFSFKVKTIKWRGNEIRYIFIVATIVLLAMFKLAAFPLVILLYVALSVFYAWRRRNSPQL